MPGNNSAITGSYKGVIQLLLPVFISLLFVSPLSFVPWLFSLFYWLMAVPVLSKVYAKDDDLLHPVLSLIILIFLYSVSAVLFYYRNNGITMYGDMISERSFSVFIASCFAGLAGVIAGWFVANRGACPPPPSKKFIATSDRAIPFLIALALLLAGLAFNSVIGFFDFIHPKSYVETALSSRVAMLEASADAPIIQVFTQIVPLVAILATGLYLLFKKNMLLRLAGGFILGANLITFMLSGSRSGMFGALAASAVYFQYRYKRIRLPIMLLGIIFSLFMLNAISLARSTANFGEMVDIVSYETKENQINLLDIGSSGELLVGLNLMKLIEAISSGESSFNLGKGFLDDILCYVPRAIYPNRPLPLSERFVEEFYPGVRDMGGGYGLFFLQDGYWAFGVIGVFFSMGLYSWALTKLYRRFIRYSSMPLVVLAYGFAYFPLVISSPRSGLLLSFKSAAVSALPFVIAFFLASFYSYKRH